MSVDELAAPEPFATGTVPNVASDQPIASTWGNLVADDVNFLMAQPTCKVKNSAPFSHTASGGWMAITWNQEDYDTASMHDVAANTSRLVAPVAGKYAIWANLRFDGNTNGLRAARVIQNNTTELTIDHKTAGTVFAGLQFITVYVEAALAAGDYVEISAFQDSGGTRTIDIGSRAGMSRFAN